MANNPLANAVDHVTVLLDKLGDQSDRGWCAGTTAKHYQSRNVLQNQNNSGVCRRTGAHPQKGLPPVWLTSDL